MLQQTQVATVIPYFQRFVERFPDVVSLASAPQQEVMALWSGLGYYSRARNLHSCAQRIVTEHGGRFPASPEQLAKLPGIGRSTAAAIAVFSSGTRAAILDGNVKRVLCRRFGIDGYPGSKSVETTLWQQAEELLPSEGVEAYTQGLMDLGATICTRSKPACTACPLADNCIALATDRVDQLPQRKPKQVLPEKQVTMLIVIENGQVLLEQRPDYGIWGGLWSLPETDAKIQDDIKRLAARFGKIEICEPLPSFAHTFTHFRLHVSPWRVHLKQRALSVAQPAHLWVDIGKLDAAPLPAPVRKLLEKKSG